MKKDKLTKLNKTFDATLIEDGVRVSLSWIGEGYDGDYDEANPDDRPLLRFDVDAHKSLNNPRAEECTKGFGAMPDSSYCTSLIATDFRVARRALKYIMAEVKPMVIAGESTKRICEKLSWLSSEDFKKK